MAAPLEPGELEARGLAEISLDDLRRCTTASYALDAAGHIAGLALTGPWNHDLLDRLDQLPGLEVLRLFQVGLVEVPSSVLRLVRLRALYLGSNERLRMLPDLRHLEHLETLGLNGTSVNPGELRLPEALRRLSLANTKLSEFPQLGKLPRLSHLYLGTNPFSTIPSWLRSQRSLRTLNLAKTQVRDLGMLLQSLTHLEDIDLSYTPLQHVDATPLKALTRLSVHGCSELNALEVGVLTELEGLDLGSTRLLTLPDRIDSASGLAFLDLSDLKSVKLPDGLYGHDRLALARFSGARAAADVRMLASFSALQAVDLSSCGLSVFPTQLMQCEHLRWLNLANNSITRVPGEVLSFGLPLVVDKKHQPEPFWNYPAYSNPYSEVRDGIHLQENPISFPPRRIIMAGTDSLRSYYASVEGERYTAEVLETKIVFVGEGGAGKTSIVDRLTADIYSEAEPPTQGIAITSHAMPLADGRVISANLWDFGGQEILHATHRFFLTERCVYVLVIDGRREDRVEYWLQHVAAYGGSAPVVIVLSKADLDASLQLNQRDLIRRYPNIASIVRTSAKDRSGIDDLYDTIVDVVSGLPHISDVWPNSWFAIRDHLAQQAIDYVSLEHFRQLCSRFGVNDLDSQDVLLKFLHDLGIVVSFRDLHLRDTNVVRAEWITDAVYALLRAPGLTENGGRLRIERLAELLPHASYPSERHGYIVELMKKFELSFNLSDEEIMLPSALPVQEPSIPDFPNSCARVAVQLEFLPKSVLVRFIVRMSSDVDIGQTWRSGAVLRNETTSTRARVRSIEELRRLELEVEGPRAREYLGVLIYVLLDICSKFETVGARVLVPLPDRTELFVSYDHLLKLEATGVTDYFPDGADHDYGVSSLLGTVEPPARTEDEILRLLRTLVEDDDSEESLVSKVNDSLLLQPNVFGLGVDLNAIVRLFMTRRTRRLKDGKTPPPPDITP